MDLTKFIPKAAVGATHYWMSLINHYSGGDTKVSIHWFRFINGKLFVFNTDSDNEYPEWVPASRVFSKPVENSVQEIPSRMREVGEVVFDPLVDVRFYESVCYGVDLPAGTKLFAKS